jgi:hypothetical protein
MLHGMQGTVLLLGILGDTVTRVQAAELLNRAKGSVSAAVALHYGEGLLAAHEASAHEAPTIRVGSKNRSSTRREVANPKTGGESRNAQPLAVVKRSGGGAMSTAPAAKRSRPSTGSKAPGRDQATLRGFFGSIPSGNNALLCTKGRAGSPAQQLLPHPSEAQLGPASERDLLAGRIGVPRPCKSEMVTDADTRIANPAATLGDDQQAAIKADLRPADDAVAATDSPAACAVQLVSDNEPAAGVAEAAVMKVVTACAPTRRDLVDDFI